MRFIQYQGFQWEGGVGIAQQLQAVALRCSNKLLRVPAHQVVFLGRNKIYFEIALIGVGFELINVVGNCAPRIERRGNNSARRGIESSDGNLVVGKRRARRGVRAGCRIKELMRRVVTDTSGESLWAKRSKIALALLVGNQIQLPDCGRLRKK